MDDAVRDYLEAISPTQRPTFDRLHRLIVETFPQADVVLSYQMPTYVVGDRRLHVGAWKNWVALYGLDRQTDGGLVDRHPELMAGRGTIQLRPKVAATISDDEFRAMVSAALG